MHKARQARFLEGSLLKHIIVMTVTNSIGLMALFAVDLIDLFFLSQLKVKSIVAAMGFASTVLYFLTAISIGLLISSTVIVSRAIGKKDFYLAKRLTTHCLITSALLLSIVALVIFLNIDFILTQLGAKEDTLTYAKSYINIILPSAPILVLSMVSGGILRALGDGKRSMIASLIAAGVNLILDPIFIFVLSLDIKGAAIATLIARACMFLYAIYTIAKEYSMIQKPNFNKMIDDFNTIFKVAIPAMLTNLATPIGSAIILANIASFGDEAISAYTTISRIIPVAFSILFALSGAISPIVGQNFGAGYFNRIKVAYKDAILFSAISVLIINSILFLSKGVIIQIFHLHEEAAYLVNFFCSGIACFFFFDALLFVTNAIFNSLGRPFWATFFNYARIFIGTVPLLLVFSHFFQAKGIIIAQTSGSSYVAIAAFMVCYYLINQLSKK